MATNEGVGKKIVEALKKQSESEIELTQEFNEVEETRDLEINNENENISDIETSDINQLYDGSFSVEENINNNLQNDVSFEIKEQNVEEIGNVNIIANDENKANEYIMSSMPKQPQGWNFDLKEDTTFIQPQINITEEEAKQFDMPPNVAVLRRLITQLPAGVTKQTGAQIIKQTMEALGISMNTVLHEAQKVQDEMNESIKNCMVSIQEYKNNIKNLEKQGLDYQRQVNQLNDLISLFILSDKD